jgi:hypothetical protein
LGVSEEFPAVMPPLVWALGFANPLLLYALAAAGVPVLIHLLNRRKYREVPWAAMRFLLSAIRKNRRRLRIEQWLLLAIRTLIILLVVSAVAKPFLESFGAIIAGQRTHKVIVIDGSLSMGYRSAESSRFDQAKEVAIQIVKDARGGDSVSVIMMGNPPRGVISNPTNNLVEVEKVIGELSQSDSDVDLVATFELVDRVLDVSSIPQKELIVLTDLQAASWKPPAEGAGALAQAVTRIEARKPRSVVIDLGRPGGENRAVTDLKVDVPVVTMGEQVLIRANLRNFGSARADGVRARVTTDGILGLEEPFDLAPGEDVPAVFRQQFTTPGDHLVEVFIDDDPLERDNHRWLVVPVRESLKVLLVNGHQKPEPYQSETDYLVQALAPGEESPGQPRPIKVEVVNESQFSRSELAPYDTVVLCNVALFSEPDVTALEDFLRQGGGVVIFGGDQVVAENYNRFLYNDGNGLLPARLGPTRGDAAKKEAGFLFNPLAYRHPLVALYQGESDPVTSGLTQARSLQYHRLELPKGSKAEVALAFDTGDPAVVESRRHRGTVIVVATSADLGWTTWPLHRSYPAIMQEIVLLASAGRLSQRNVRVGEPFDRSFEAIGASAPVTVTTPKKQTVTTKLEAKGGVSQFRFDQTDTAGQYEVKIGPPLARDTLFAANTNPAESDLTKLDRTGLAGVFPNWKFSYLINWKELAEDASSVGRKGEMHRPLLYGVLILLLVESFLAWRFGHHDPST